MEFRAKDDRKGYVKPEQVKILINYFKQKAGQYDQNSPLYYKQIRKALLIHVMFSTGRRISEVVGLKPFTRVSGLRPIDIDFDTNKITWSILKKNPVRKKTKKGNVKTIDVLALEIYKKQPYYKTIIAPTKLLKQLKFWIDKMQTGNTQRIFPFTKDYFNRELKKACMKLKIKLDGKRIRKDKHGNLYEDIYWISSHSFRHGYAQSFLKSNEDNPKALPILSKNMVHSNLNVTNIYLHSDEETTREMTEKNFEKN